MQSRSTFSRRHSIFDRYWQHYDEAQRWYDRHKFAKLYSETNAAKRSERIKPCCGCILERQSADNYRFEMSNLPSRSIASDDTEVEMEITDELIEFFEQSEKFKKERRQLKEEQKRIKKYSKQSKDDPFEPMKQISAQRTSEIKFLYGDASPKIHGMEAAMQLSFDRYWDLRQPQFWPVIPLNL